MDFKRPPKWKRFLKKATLVMLALLPTMTLAGIITQRHLDADFFTQHPPLGSFA